MITTFYPPYNFGGDGIFVKRLANELARRGHKVEVIHCIDAYDLLSSQEPKGSYQDHPNVIVHGLKSRFGFLSPLATYLTGVPFFKSSHIQRILNKGFDVIHYHNISLVGGPKILEYGQGIKLYTMHEYWLICPTHILFRFNRAPCTRPMCLPCSLTYRRPPQCWRYLGLLKAAVNHVDCFIALNQFIRTMHRQMGFQIPIEYIPGFVPLSEDSSATSNPLTHEISKDPFFLFVGRLKKLKGLQTLIPIFRRYPKAQLWIAGTGDDESWLRRMAEGIPNIRFLGYLPGPKLQPLYRKAAAIIVPSICFEASPLVIFEAFREQTPVIVRNLGGLPEMVEQSRGGLCYKTEEELEAAMDRLLSDPSYRQELGRQGYEAYLRNWTAEAHLKQYFELIHKIATGVARV
jgi:glycosyltransferase involved in cell wall biosynthesis